MYSCAIITRLPLSIPSQVLGRARIDFLFLLPNHLFTFYPAFYPWHTTYYLLQRSAMTQKWHKEFGLFRLSMKLNVTFYKLLNNVELILWLFYKSYIRPFQCSSGVDKTKPWTKWSLPDLVNKILLEHSHTPLFIGAAFILHWLSWSVDEETIWPTKSKIFITWHYLEKVC